LATTASSIGDEFSTHQQLAFEAYLIATARVDYTTTNIKLTHPDNSQAQLYARVSNTTTYLTQLDPAQAQCTHASVSRPICEFLHSSLTRAAERERKQITDVSKDIHSGGMAIHSSSVTKNDHSGVSSAYASDITAERKCTRTFSEDIYSQCATTDARSGDASASARDVTQESVHQQSATQSERAPNLKSASSADETKTSASSVVVVNKDAYRYGATNSVRSCNLRADACAVSHLTCDTKVLIPLLMQLRTETSSQPCQPENALNMQPHKETSSQPYQPEHALNTQPRMESSSQPCKLKHALDIMPVSTSVRDATVHTLPAPTSCEDSSQPCQPEHALSIMPVSPSTRDAAVPTLLAPP